MRSSFRKDSSISKSKPPEVTEPHSSCAGRAGKALAFGENGKLLVDMDGNRYVVEDIDALPPTDREKFLHYVYW